MGLAPYWNGRRGVDVALPSSWEGGVSLAPLEAGGEVSAWPPPGAEGGRGQGPSWGRRRGLGGAGEEAWAWPSWSRTERQGDECLSPPKLEGGPPLGADGEVWACPPPETENEVWGMVSAEGEGKRGMEPPPKAGGEAWAWSLLEQVRRRRLSPLLERKPRRRLGPLWAPEGAGRRYGMGKGQ